MKNYIYSIKFKMQEEHTTPSSTVDANQPHQNQEHHQQQQHQQAQQIHHP